MLGNEPDILDSKFEDDTTLSLWTNQKDQKVGLHPYGAKNDHAPWY